MKFIKKIMNKVDHDEVVVKKVSSGEWAVQKGFSILYMGTKENCNIFKRHIQRV